MNFILYSVGVNMLSIGLPIEHFVLSGFCWAFEKYALGIANEARS